MPKLRLSRMDVFVLILSFVALEILTYYNSFIADLKAGEIDSARFQEQAIWWARYGEIGFVTNSEFYIQLLGIIFRLFGDSEFIGTQFGLIAVFVGAYYFLKVFQIYEMRFGWVFLALLLLWPSHALRFTTTMREPYLLACTLASAYYLIEYYRFSLTKSIVKAFIALLVAFFFHKAYTICFMVLAFYISLFVLKSGNSKSSTSGLPARIGMVLVATVVTVFGVQEASQGNRGFNALGAVVSADTEYMSRIVQYKSERDARATYGVAVDFSSITSVVTSLPVVTAYYLHYPFPWNVSNIYDASASIEGLVRFICLFILLYYLFVRKLVPSGFYALLVVVGCLTLIWAAGTSNYGTASRHHTTTNWFYLVVIGLYLQHWRSFGKSPKGN